MHVSKRFIASMLFCLGAGALASAKADEVPVVDANQDSAVIATGSNAPIVASSLSVEQRLAQIERQLANRSQVDLLSQIGRLQQQVQELQGQFEIQGHDLKTLQEQQRQQFQDLDQRLSKQQPSAKDIGASKNNSDATVQQPPKKTATGSMGEDTNSSDALEQQKAYMVGYNLLKAKKYDQAKASLQGFIKKYPAGTYATNAHYWLGEIALLQGKPDEAIIEFNKVIKENPNRAKLAEANLKLGYAYYDKGRLQQARGQFTKVKQQFVGTSAAELATARLQEMQQQGH